VGNERLTAYVAALLLVLLAVEGTTLVSIQSMLSLHVFVGMLLVPFVALKMASAGYRFVRYYTGAAGYRRRGPPAVLMRLLVAPLVVASTLVLFATGIALIAFAPHSGMMLSLHKASFIVWFSVMSLHVIAYVAQLPALLRTDLSGRERAPGAALRLGLVGCALVTGVALAVWTLPLAGGWLHRHDRELRAERG
jgi:hypothetical protein